MTTDDLLGQRAPFRGQRDAIVQRNQAAGFHLVDHLGNRGARHFEAFGDTRLNHIQIVFAKLENCFAIFFERRVPLAGTHRLSGIHIILRRLH